MNTIVGMFDNRNQAMEAQRDLLARGFDADQVRITDETTGSTSHAAGQEHRGQEHRGQEHQGFWESVKDFFGFGDEDEDRLTYEEGLRRGGTLLSVRCDDDSRIDTASDILRRHGAVDLDSRTSNWKQEGWSPRTNVRSSAPQGGATHTTERAGAIPVVEEELRVGKQQVSRGGVRVHSRVTERPVREQVSLKDEHVHVERRPVDRPLTAADEAGAFRERSVEATETAERAVVGKEARVVEEVLVKKDTDRRVETVTDTVRRTDVDVEKIPGETKSRTTRSSSTGTGQPTRRP